MEQFLGHLLRTGVALAALVVLAGGALYLARHGSESADRHTFRGEPEELRSVPGVLSGVAEGQARAVVQLGLLLLIATPVLRVASSMIGFARERDRTYVALTGVVLALLLASLFGGR